MANIFAVVVEVLFLREDGPGVQKNATETTAHKRLCDLQYCETRKYASSVIMTIARNTLTGLNSARNGMNPTIIGYGVNGTDTDRLNQNIITSSPFPKGEYILQITS